MAHAKGSIRVANSTKHDQTAMTTKSEQTLPEQEGQVIDQLMMVAENLRKLKILSVVGSEQVRAVLQNTERVVELRLSGNSEPLFEEICTISTLKQVGICLRSRQTYHLDISGDPFKQMLLWKKILSQLGKGSVMAVAYTAYNGSIRFEAPGGIQVVSFCDTRNYRQKCAGSRFASVCLKLRQGASLDVGLAISTGMTLARLEPSPGALPQLILSQQEQNVLSTDP